MALVDEFIITAAMADPNHANWALLKGRSVTIWLAAGDEGRKRANAVAALIHAAQAAEIRIVEPPADWPDGCTLAQKTPPDHIARDLLKLAKPWQPARGQAKAETRDEQSGKSAGQPAAVNSGAEAKTTAAAQEPKQATMPDFAAEVARLPELKPLEYTHTSKTEAKRLGVPVKALDEEVKAHRKAKAAAEKPKSRAHLKLAASNGKPSAGKTPRRDMFAPVEVSDWP